MEVDVYVFVCISVQKSFKDAFLYILHGHFEHEIAQVPDSIFKILVINILEMVFRNSERKYSYLCFLKI